MNINQDKYKLHGIMIFFFEVRLIKAQAWVFFCDSFAVWTNLPNAYNDWSDPFENISLNFFVIFPRLRSKCSVYWIDLSADSLKILSVKKWNSSSTAFKLQKLQSLFSFLILYHFLVTIGNLFDKRLSLDMAFPISKILQI